MVKRFAYIVLLLIMAPALSFAKKYAGHGQFIANHPLMPVYETTLADTALSKNARHQQEQDDKKKIKEIAKARRQPKPEKIVTGDVTPAPKIKPKRQRRPEGLERPPEIPRRNGN